jgi:AraC-like DNA-binding protein/mannose-6-phosphate isomerase-like protein (cupin superfamily)
LWDDWKSYHSFSQKYYNFSAENRKNLKIMDINVFQGHKFQLITFCYVYHPKKWHSTNIQLNSDSHILHITKGKGVIKLESQAYKLRRGCVIAIPPFVPFTMDISDDFEMMNIHYKIWLENDVLLSSLKRLPAIFIPQYFDWCEKTLLEMKKIQEQTVRLKAPDALAHEIVLRHFAENRITDIAGDVSDPRMKKLREHLENPKIKSFNSKELESMVFLSKSQINRKFGNSFGLSPHKYWEKQRLKNVCAHLAASSGAIYEIADLEGFKDHGYFCRWFRKMTGFTPAEYRKKLSDKDRLL